MKKQYSLHSLRKLPEGINAFNGCDSIDPLNGNPHSNPSSLLADFVNSELIEPEGIVGVVDNPRNIPHALEMFKIHPDLPGDSETENKNIVVIVNAIKNIPF